MSKVAEVVAVGWRMKLKEQRELKKQGAELLHRRVSLLVELESDGEFLEWCESEDQDVYAYLDDELSDVAADYFTLKKVLEHFPLESSWKRTGLREMMAEVIELDRKERKPRDGVSWKQKYSEMEKECERLRGELKESSARISELERVIELMAAGRREQGAA